MKNKKNNRRDFLKKAAIVGLAAPHLAFSTSLNESAKTESMNTRPKYYFLMSMKPY